MMRKKLIVVLSMIAIFALSSFAADFRVWSDKKGNTIEAKFVQVTGPKITLEKRDGKLLMVPKDGLCKADQVYLAKVIPPELKIKVDKDEESEKLSESLDYISRRETISLKINIQKTNKDPSSRKFKATVYFIAEAPNNDKRKVIGHTEESFSFEKGSSFKLSTDAQTQYRKYGASYIISDNTDLGWEFEGYIIIVKDDEGRTIAVETTKSTYESKLATIEKNKNQQNGFKF